MATRKRQVMINLSTLERLHSAKLLIRPRDGEGLKPTDSEVLDAYDEITRAIEEIARETANAIARVLIGDKGGPRE